MKAVRSPPMKREKQKAKEPDQDSRHSQKPGKSFQDFNERLVCWVLPWTTQAAAWRVEHSEWAWELAGGCDNSHIHV